MIDAEFKEDRTAEAEKDDGPTTGDARFDQFIESQLKGIMLQATGLLKALAAKREAEEELSEIERKAEKLIMDVGMFMMLGNAMMKMKKQG